MALLNQCQWMDGASLEQKEVREVCPVVWERVWVCVWGSDVRIVQGVCWGECGGVCLLLLLAYAIATVFQLYHGSYMICEMRRRKSEPTL